MDEALLLSFSEIEDAHWWFVVRRRIVEHAIASLVPVPTRVLEVGCGTGYFLRCLSGNLPEAAITGIEPNGSALEMARGRGCSVSPGTFETIPIDTDDPVDLVVALDVLEHCEDDGLALRRAVAAMSAGARIVLTVPALPVLWGPHDEANQHYRRYTAAELGRALESAGLRVQRLTYFNLLLLPLGFVTRMVSRLARTRALSGVKMPIRPVNAALTAIFSLEVPLLRHWDLPLGMSLLAVAEKPERKND
ncbi:MAG: class I SAM-dependent methyltransferase [Coriobacteriia bacterium]|nr:class I SAM-dependent methyltransferase [Coriobacteriia bacterium]